MPVRILPDHLINMIAAGEVIERPASVIKELVENAIDAGANQIAVTLENAGKSRIIVRDNGHGMLPKDLELSVERHATSKLVDDDLSVIKTLGFRGEALPSIGAIARLQLISRPPESDSAWEISVAGGKKGTLQPARANPGTTVDVRDLFFAIPARLKFLKADTTEIAHITEIVCRLALVNPHIGFTLHHHEKLILRYARIQERLLPTSPYQQRVEQVLGVEFIQNSRSILTERDGMSLQGFISLPTYHRTNSQEQYIFVNNRPVRDRQLQSAVRVAYQDVIAHNRYPAVVLYLAVPSDQIDVNVHPAKTEVRFRQADRVRSLVISAIKSRLVEQDIRTAPIITQQATPYFKSSFSSKNNGFPGFILGEKPSSFHWQQNQQQDAKPANQPFIMAEQPSHDHVTHSTNLVSPHFLGNAVAQIHRTYIIAQTEEKMVIVDQHAAHERLVYEKMKNALTDQAIKRQLLLIPEIVNLPAGQAEMILEKADDLQKLGLTIESFGLNTILVREVPAMLMGLKVPQTIIDLAAQIYEQGDSWLLQNHLHEVCGTLACHSSIRAGHTMTVAEMNALLRQMEETPNSSQCNHGRPTYIELRREDMEKLFGRR
ncbi:MAG: DNA mismatch repair endonuclease MutL [Alphaproteobacteria bacterium]|nr:DNA mismatch repair endonuclease MutL [Alphaproteobacteria bacterium]